MTKKAKLLLKFISNPQSLKLNKIETLLDYLGFTAISIKGSHKKYRHEKLATDIISPTHNNDCKKVYKIIIAKIIKTLLS